VVGWAAVLAARGGIDEFDGQTGRGPTAAFLALAVAGPAAAGSLWLARNAGALRAGPTRLALVGAAGTVVWDAVSIAWAIAPDRAWTAANVALIGLAALCAGLALGTLVRRAGSRLVVALSAAALPTVAWALSAAVAPDRVGGGFDPQGRLQAPLGLPNPLGLAAVIAVPGALWLVARPGPRPGGRALRAIAAAWLVALLTTVALTQSRSGVLALLAAIAIVLWLAPGRAHVLGGIAAAAVGALPSALYGLSASGFDPVASAASRRSAGLVLGLLLVLGMALAAGLTLAAPLVRARWPGPPSRGVRIAAAVLGACVLALGVAGLADRWTGERGTSHRTEWWDQAARGWTSSPLVGHGADSFKWVGIRESPGEDLRGTAREPHQLELQTLSDTGVIGLFLLAATVGGPLWAAARLHRRGVRAPLALPLAVLAAVLVQSQLDIGWSYPAFLAAALGCGGVLLAPLDGPRPALAWGWPAAAGLALAGAVCVLSALFPWWSARLAATSPSRAGALAAANRARTLNPLSLAPLQLRETVLLSRGDATGALEAAREETSVQPDNYVGWVHVAGLTPLPSERRDAVQRAADLGSPLG
jgi:hypothetical protein